MAVSGVYLNIDASNLQKTIDTMKLRLSHDEFMQLIHRTFREVGQRSKTLIAAEVVKDYAATKSWVRSQIGGYRIEQNLSGGYSCVIPISGARGVLGARFTASGTGPITVKLLKKKSSTLPPTLPHQGGQPPFRNLKSNKLGGVVFTRKTKARFPIARVAGIGVPQMPLNQSEDEVSQALLDYAMQRLNHNFYFMFNRVK